MLRICIRALGVGFFLQGLGWIAQPERAAESLGMPLLDGLARSTQAGDFASFFLVAGATMLIGSGLGRERLLYVPAALIGGASITRTLAWALHGAAFATLFISVEVGVGVLLLYAARTLAGDT